MLTVTQLKNLKSKVADIMGKKQAAIARLESSLSSGEHSPSLRTLKSYAPAVGCHLDIRFIHDEVIAV